MELKNYNILVSDGLAQEGVEILSKFKNFDLTINDKTNKEELLEIIEKFDGIIVRSATKITPDVIRAGKKLKVIVRAGTGYDNINIEECNKLVDKIASAKEKLEVLKEFEPEKL